jgi:hypothetical protein
MRFMVLIRANERIESGVPPTLEQITATVAFNEELVKAGIALALEGLHPSAKGARIAFRSGKTAVTDGPFAETKELIGGFWIVQAKSMEEVVECFKRAPMLDGDVLEIRKIIDVEDYSEALPPELRERIEADWS